MALKPCRGCGQQLSVWVSKCPACGTTSPTLTAAEFKVTVVIAIVLLVSFGVLAARTCAPSPAQRARFAVEDSVSSARFAAREAVRSLLKDPESAQFGNLMVVRNWRGILVVCGTVNARNSFGGYTGAQGFISYGSPAQTTLSTGLRAGDYAAAWQDACGRGTVLSR